MNYYNPFNLDDIPECNLDNIELKYYELAISGNNYKKFLINNLNDLKKYALFANKYKILYKVTKSPSKGGSGHFEVHIYFPLEQTDNNFIQNEYFKVQNILNQFTDNNTYCKNFLNTPIYNKIAQSNKTNDIIAINMDNITLDDICDLDNYGQYYGYQYKITDTELVLNRINTAIQYTQGKPKELKIQKLLFELQSKIIYNYWINNAKINNRLLLSDSKLSLVGHIGNSENDTTFWNICKDFLKQKNMSISFDKKIVEFYLGDFEDEIFNITLDI